MRSFKKFFQQLNEGSSENYGITHIEDLPIEAFLRLVKNIHKLHAVQKLDGANLQLGLDLKGKLYTSREPKGGDRYYKIGDYPSTSTYDGFRAAHRALEQVNDAITAVMKPGQAIGVEVIFGEQPNTVIYGKDNKSWLAFLEPMVGDDPTIELAWDLSKKLCEAIGTKTVTTNLQFSDTTDGTTIVTAPRNVTWGFTRSDVVPEKAILKVNVQPEIAKLEKFLERANGEAHDLGYDVTNYEVLKGKEAKLRDIKKSLTEQVRTDYLLPIKQKLMGLVKSVPVSLRSPDAKKQPFSDIEGIIFADRKTGEKFKVVDRDDFTAVNKFNYQVRDRIRSQPLTGKAEASLEDKGGIVGDAKLRCIKLFGIDGAEIPIQAKRALEPYLSKTSAATIKNIVDALDAVNYNSIRRKMTAIWMSALSDLDDALDEFKSTVDKLELDLKDGRKVKYTPEVRRRTLMVFAEANKICNKYLKELRASHDLGSLLEIFLGKTIDELQDTRADAPTDVPEVTK
jgi:hypothetical protein